MDVARAPTGDSSLRTNARPKPGCDELGTPAAPVTPCRAIAARFDTDDALTKRRTGDLRYQDSASELIYLPQPASIKQKVKEILKNIPVLEWPRGIWS